MTTMLVVHTQFDNNSVDYAIYSMTKMTSLASGPIEFRIKTLGQVGVTSQQKEILGQLPIADIISIGQGSGSGGHALAIEAAIGEFVPRTDNVICDADTVVLAKGWDQDIINALRVTGVIGTTYEDIGGFSSGSGPLQTYKGIPNVVWAGFSGRFDWSKLKAQPMKGVPLAITNSMLSQIYGLPVGSSVLRDVCWQLPVYIYDNGIPALGWRQIKPSSTEAIVLRDCSDYHEEYHFPLGKPFVVHQRGSMKHKFRQADLSKKFYDQIESFLRST